MAEPTAKHGWLTCTLSHSARQPLLRNDIEHFDERLDEFCAHVTAGGILPTYVGPMVADPEIPTHLFRAFYTDVGVLEILGKRYPVHPILDELRRIIGA